MAEFLAYRIFSGKLEYSHVPEARKYSVGKILVEIGCKNLTEISNNDL